MPGYYAEPKGKILLLWDDDVIVGGVALRPLDDPGICEMKRLFIREGWRGRGFGRQMTAQILEAAQQAGYSKMRLDTEKRLLTAIDMYRQFGFAEIGRYYDNPLEEILYMEKDLS